MNNRANIGVSTIIMLMIILLIGTTAASVMTNNMKNQRYNENNINNMISEVVDEITTYIQIKDVVGRYTTMEGHEKIRHIALLVTPLISSDIDITDISIKISNGYQIKYIHYGEKAGFIGSHSLFNHPIYNQTSSDIFNIIILNDKDQSITNYNTINDQSDLAYIVITLSEDIALRYDESLTLTLLLPRGYTRTVLLQAPLPIRPVVTFD